jgi:hypothetical protein
MSVFRDIYKQKNNESSRPSLGAPEPASGRPSLGIPGQSTVSLFSLLDQSDKDFLFEEGNEKLLAQALDTQVKSGRPSFGGMLTNTPTEEKAVKDFAPAIDIAKGTAKGREFFQSRTQAGEIPDYIARLSQPSQTATLPTLMNLPTLPIGRQKLGTARQNPFKTAAKQDLVQSGLFQPSLPKLNLYGFERAPNMQPGTLQRIATAGQEMIKSGQALNPTILKATSV